MRATVPDMHVHAFSPLEVHQGAATLGLPVGEFLSEVIRRNELQAWFVAEHVVDAPLVRA